ncbi:hypothetical protein L13192_02929 [Pyrenophora tritici-repentis]|uniref:Uncharacterized protein n=1 Tax=Pyrenophora tritici-repentis TaxID=45151 RepID=A0A922SZA7_9PLEO|nr:hypothetical protein Ptr86124_001632 [Pyrenophora tritici-repentis]KAI1672070.1 hypothetical protein L13192_02929 [Pyrenophora tritici-repentis]KAI1686079.1 hypothetical protein KJE20_04044 [Pyrenophora tritici-repentis]
MPPTVAGLAMNRIPPSYRVANGAVSTRADQVHVVSRRPASPIQKSFTPLSLQRARINSLRASVSRASLIAASFSRPTLSERALRPASSTPKAAPDSAHQPPLQLLLVAPQDTSYFSDDT